MYTGMFNCGAANFLQYVFEKEPTKTIPPICTFSSITYYFNAH